MVSAVYKEKLQHAGVCSVCEGYVAEEVEGYDNGVSAPLGKYAVRECVAPHGRVNPLNVGLPPMRFVPFSKVRRTFFAVRKKSRDTTTELVTFRKEPQVVSLRFSFH